MSKLKLDGWQKQFLSTKGDKILCTGRQVGKTEICSRDAANYATTHPNTVTLMIAPTERQAFYLFDKTLDYLDKNSSLLIRKGAKRPTKQRIHLRNGSIIRCLPTGTSGIGIRGYTVHRLYVDEASRVPEEVWAAVQPMLLTTGGDTILLSTPFGAQGEFWRTWVNKDGAYNSFTRFSIDSENAIREREISMTWTELQRTKALERIEQAKARMSKREFAQEYLGHFVEDLFRFFSDDLINQTCTLKRPETIKKKPVLRYRHSKNGRR